ncbi:uncharacterized protein TRIVIDRAFT_65245 [Trichoderma virens Gv29-8]|uniref:Uncharacterized protein n=1 Tax=Hypocrea virens (strain Gv29-8 / FGSC 10586) TaxID=413071 RepID=G9NAR7_HYPVG|nr:uncharacterized protein TRIVIDRAFT_65245 [Trichoderma virens Gv29-8]EHK15928.1 hypothetical protein TRIVIDRAFT_65245 [Trichoderma virens Gv29-8]UKZ56299.1 hypothetical protein TrVGV298_010134 [Trichoderma virens]
MADRRPRLKSLPALRLASTHEKAARLQLTRESYASVYPKEIQAPYPPGDTLMTDVFEGDNASESEERDEEVEDAVARLDIDAADRGILHLDQTLLPPGFDEAEFRNAAEYNDLGFDEDDTFSIDSEDEIIHPDTAHEGMPTPQRPSAWALEDQSVLVRHTPRPDIVLSDFELALGLMAHISGVSNRDWSMMREILQIPSVTERERAALNRLPLALATLKNQVTKAMPLLDMRSVDVSLKVDKMPTMAPSDKGNVALDVQTAKMHFFDPVDLFKKILESQLPQQLHLDMAHFVDEPSEFYHSRAWASSIRTSSGHYAHFIAADGEVGDAIFPSDWIYFSCDSPDCQCTSLDTPDIDQPDPTVEEIKAVAHIGRVVGFGKCYQTDRHPLVKLGEVTLLIQEAWRPNNPRLSELVDEVSPEPDELVLNLGGFYCLSQTAAIDFCRVTIDREPEDDGLEDPSFFKKSRGSDPHPKHSPNGHRARHPDDEWIVRRVSTQLGTVDWYCNQPTIRAELELQVYGRSWFETRWDRLAPNNQGPFPIALPCTTFIDGFGLFRNSYRTLVGMYMTLAGLCAAERRRRANTLPILLSPHGSVFEEAIDALRCFIPLDKGVELDIHGAPTIVCVFTLCFIGDMLQQNQNAGCLGPTAGKFCRFCFIGKKTIVDAFNEMDPCAILDFDCDKHGRYSHQISKMRHYASSLPSQRKREYFSQWGLTTKPSNLEKIAPALDPIWTRVPDAAHSEYNGMSNLFHALLIKAILRPEAVKEYSRMLRAWKFPSGWNRLQSPVHYLSSYSLSDHARWSVIIPGLLNAWLTKNAINPSFWNAAVERPELDGLELIDWIVRAFARLARSNDYLMGNNARFRDSYAENALMIVLSARADYQRMCVWASWELAWNHERRNSQDSQASSAASTVSNASHLTRVLQRRVREQEERGGETSEFEILLRDALIREAPAAPAPAAPARHRRGRHVSRDNDEKSTWLADALRPNVHVGNHLVYFFEEYAGLSNIDTLVGEAEHKWFKNVVYKTNLKDTERVLLGKVNLQLVCRLFILGAYNTTYPQLSAQIRRLWRACPTLFERIMSRSDERVALDESDFGHQEVVGDTNSYSGITATGRIHQVNSLGDHAANNNMRLPSIYNEITDSFRALLLGAYAGDYDIHDVSLSQARSLFWYKKFGFTNKQHRRYVFKLGDYIEFEGHRHVGRVDGIFTHEQDGLRRIFIVVMGATPSNRLHELLSLPYIDHDQPYIIGVPSVDATSGQYIIDDRAEPGNTSRQIWVSWNPKFL